MGLIYLAHAIDHAVDDLWGIDEAANSLHVAGHTVYRPAHAWRVPPEYLDSRLVEINNTVLGKCDAVFAILHPDVLTIGTILEIERARLNDQPAVVLAEQDLHSFALVWLNVPVFTQPRAAVDWLTSRLMEGA